jgi:hypothetical protein
MRHAPDKSYVPKGIIPGEQATSKLLPGFGVDETLTPAAKR